MSFDPFQELILTELKDLKQDIKDVRQTDIPAIKEDIKGFHGKIKSLEKQQTWSTRIYTVLGGAIAVAIAKYTGHNSGV